MNDARRALAFLTPLGGAAPPSPAALAWFPVVGAALGAVLGVAWWGLSKVWPAAVVAIVVVALDLALTGMLHLDGLVDSADGLLPHSSRARRLAIMREPTVGAYGVGIAAVALVARWAALFSMRPSVLLLVSLWAASRTMMAVVATAGPYAREGDADGGIASAFLGSPRAGAVAAAIGAPVALAAAVWAIAGVAYAGTAALGAGLVGAVCVVWLARRRLGGFTGDVLGAAGVTLETVGLLVAAARW